MPPGQFHVQAALGTTAVEFSLSGGVGYIPLVISGLERHDGWILERETATGVWEWLDQSIHNNDYWQCMFDPISNSYSLTFNILNESAYNYRLRWEP